MNIGQLFLELLADGAKLQPQVEAEAAKAGDAGAKTLGQRLGAGLKTAGVKAFGLAATAAFSIATKGALEMEEVQVRIQAETGATAEEAKAMGATINRVAGDNQMALNDVAEAAIRVRRDLGATGEEADQLTADFAEFARVTRQDAAGAVEDFDDILDAWGLQATDARRIQDLLLASTQKYGGSIVDRQKALADLAPQLRALNADEEDGVALLNLFAASGLDASKATFALNTAVRKLKPGQSIDDLVAQVTAIEDPTERAQKAIELFGSRGGVSLANALRPGINGLDDFAVAAEDAQGTVDKAADAIDSKWFGIPKLFSQAGAALRGLGAEAGPVLTALGGLASIAGTIFPDFGPTLGRKLLAGFKLPVAGLKAIGNKMMGLIGLGIGQTVIGDAVADSVTSGMRSGKLVGATGKLGQFLGSKLGKGLSVAFAAVAIFEVFETYNRIKAELEAQTAANQENVGNQIASGTTESLEQSKAALEQGLRDINETWDAGIFTTDARKGMEAQLAAVEAEIAKRAQALPEAAAEGIEAGTPAVEGALGNMVPSDFAGSDWYAQSQAAAKEAGEDIPEAYANGIEEKQSLVPDAFSRLIDLMKGVISRPKEIARLIGQLTSKGLAEGLAHNRPAVRAEAQRVQADAEERLATLIANGGKVGKDAMKELKKGLNSGNPEVRASAQRVQNIVKGKLEGTVGPAGKAGTKAGNAFAGALRQAIVNGRTITIAAGIQVSLGQISGARALGGPVGAGEAYLVGERGPELFVPETNGRVLTTAQSVAAVAEPGSGGATYNIPLTVQGALPVRTPRDVVTELRRIGELGQLPAATLSPKYHRREATR